MEGKNKYVHAIEVEVERVFVLFPVVTATSYPSIFPSFHYVSPLLYISLEG